MYALPSLVPAQVLMYLRKSRTDDPALTVAETLSRHEQMLDDFSQKTWGALVPEQNRFREVVSGETIDARPEVQRVLRLAESASFRAILVVEPQRLSRGDLEDIGRLSKILRYTGTLVLTLQGSFDLADERDRDFFERELKRGNEYLEYQKRIMGNGRAASVERGNYLGTTAPYGYERVWLREGKKKAPSLAILPDEAENVLLIFRLYADGVGATSICKRLNESGVPARSASAWRPSSITSILDNPVYAGMVRWQSTREKRVIVSGELERHRVRQDDYPLFPGKHEAIVPGALWEAVRVRREARSIPRARIALPLVNPFAGLVRCSCGAAVVMHATGSRASARIKCAEQHVCGTGSCRYQDFVQAVADALRENLENLEAVAGGGSAPDNSAEIARLQKRVAALQQKEAGIWEKYAEGMPRAIFEDLLAKTQAEQQQAAALLDAETARACSQADVAAQVVTLHQVLDLLPQLDGAPVREANKLLRACIKQITYSRPRSDRSGGCVAGWQSGPIQLQIELAF